MNLWLALIFSGLVTFATRLSFIWLVGERTMPPWLRRGLRYVPPAVLSAIIFPEVFLLNGALDLAPWSNARLAAALIAALVAWRTRHALATIAVGMLALWLIQAML